MSPDFNLVDEKSANVQSPKKMRGHINILNENLVNILDKCKIGDREAVQLIFAVVSALNLDVKGLILNKTSLGEYRKKLRESQVKNIMEEFNSSDLKAVIVHWDGKILPTMNKHEKIERLPVLISNGQNEKLLGNLK